MTDEEKQKVRDYQKQYRENMTGEQKQKYKINQKQYKENVTDEEKQKYKEAKNKRDRDRYNNIKNCQKSRNKKEEIIKNNIQKM